MRSDSVQLRSSTLVDADKGLSLAATRILYPYEYWHPSRQDGVDDGAQISPRPDSDSRMREDRVGGPVCSSQPLWYRATHQLTAFTLALCAFFRKWIVYLARIFMLSQRGRSLYSVADKCTGPDAQRSG
jgi:hypothetical protein